MTISTYTVARPGSAEPAAVTVAEAGAGRPLLLLHGGAGPFSFLAFGGQLARERPARVLTPTHPGWNGTPRPDDLTDIRGLAELYVALIDQLGLTGVTVVGNSIGGWIAAELALLASPRVSGVVILNGVGISVPGHPVADFFALTPAELADLSYADPARFRIDPDALPDAQKAVMAANRQAIALFAGTTMADPGLADRLAAVTVPTCVLWGESDRIVDPEYGKAYAAAIPGAVHRPLTGAGHLPQLETPQQTLEAVWDFAR
jgi:pimeloyl-ACP methyl ester carboxylesterase